jgi:TonB-linked SusC/RagA family outer membrane protein
MKKLHERKGIKSPFLKFDLKMKLTVLLVFTSFFSMLASTGYSQVITLDAKNTAVEKVIDKIEVTSKYTFVYNTKFVDLHRKVSINVKDVLIETVLSKLFDGTKTSYEVIDTEIFLKERESVKKEVIKQSSMEAIQEHNIKGVVQDENGQPLVGANIIEKGTTNGTQTDFDGNFSIDIVDENAILVVSYLGFLTQEVTVSRQTSITVILKEDSAKLDEIVVTALGLSRKEKSLGYSVQKVEGESISKANEVNVVNSLTGKVSGLQITRSGNGLTGSSRVVLRGDRSLNLNQNQALFVINGVPVNNSVFATNGTAAIRGGGATDFGNAISELDPNTIESISVLKGPSAAALYGSRGANGVILITTKTGVSSQGINVEYNSSLFFEDILRWADYQNEYGAGRDGQGRSPGGIFDANNGADSRNSRSFGSPFEGQSYLQFDENGDVISRPWVARANILEDFFRTGIQLRNNISIAGGGKTGDFRLSLTDEKNTGIVPFTDLNRFKVGLSAGFRPNDKIELRTNIDFIRSGSENVATSGHAGDASISYALNWWQRNKDLKEFKNFTAEDLRDNLALATFNPWFAARDINNGFEKNRFVGQLQAKYKFSPDMELMLRSGGDYFNDFRTVEQPINPRVGGGDGFYQEQDILFTEINTDFLLSYNKELSNSWSLNASLGGNSLYQLQRIKTASINDIAIPGTFNLLNSSSSPVIDPVENEKIINSLYAFAQLGFKGHTFFDVTARNDWSSTLPKGKNSYFYPSFSLSNVFSDAFDLKSETFSFGKIRLSYAQVGNDTDPHLTNKTFRRSGLFNGNLGVTHQTFIENTEVRPERTSSIEAGLDLRFFKGRFGIDFTYYNTTTKDQLILAPVSEVTGYNNKLINVGETKSRGIELELSGRPIQNENGFNWDINFNISQSRSEIVDLGNNIESLVLGRSGGLTIEAREGERFGDIYGFDFLRSPDGQIVHENGLPRRGEVTKLGNYNPDWQGGIQNTFTYKNFTLSTLFDFRIGGEVYSYTYTNGSRAGTWTNTLAGREDGLIGDGVIDNGDGTFRPNDVRVIPVGTSEPSVYDYYQVFYQEGIQSHSVFDASFAKLREVSLTYQLPKKILDKTLFKSLSVSLIGRNLALITDVPVIDPEVLTLNGNNILPGIESWTFPPTKTYGLSLNAKF